MDTEPPHGNPAPTRALGASQIFENKTSIDLNTMFLAPIKLHQIHPNPGFFCLQRLRPLGKQSNGAKVLDP